MLVPARLFCSRMLWKAIAAAESPTHVAFFPQVAPHTDTEPACVAPACQCDMVAAPSDASSLQATGTLPAFRASKPTDPARSRLHVHNTHANSLSISRPMRLAGIAVVPAFAHIPPHRP
ncbi:hypothetical protein COCSADRAFT_40255 [Bipolaris sorokiniana ND90Pr]|uniref:Uncharacterized protein n=1 Tax=Cochliobolus sativus (strain ND90Pr / ATCC 201652) TaxID=665912 RepID=M2SUZ2_COCSN|nr:uncharacterized protein COCSADRAFT_40255 [Bipolaris sorokiniana ND90Pr]EMD60627.1 hypothetical protein COCSADRAFT_40255 [Bipolaris sorokiniana ND90Pr]